MSQSAATLPQLDPAHYTSQLFWLFVTFSLLYLVLSRGLIPKIRGVLQDRQNRIEVDLEQAAILNSKAEAAKNEYETSLKFAKEKAARLTAEAHATIDEEIKRRHAELDKTLHDRMEKAELKVASLVEETQEQLLPITEKLADIITEKVLHSNMASNDGVLDEKAS